MDGSLEKGCRVLLKTCADVKKDEKILIITDDTSEYIAREFYKYAKEYADTTMVLMADRETHGSSPTDPITQAMLAVDVIFAVTKFSIYNSTARINACKNGARFVNMADYSLDMLKKGPLFVDFEAQSVVVDDLTSRLVGEDIVIISPAGTDFKAKINGMETDTGLGRSLEKGEASSPPDIECAVGPVEGTSTGILIIDGSIPLPGVGVLDEPVKVTVENGLIKKIEGGIQAHIFAEKLAAFNDERAYMIAEIGVGLNPMASLSGRMLEDEAAYGTMHIGIGNNLSYGGKCATNVHIDMIMRRPSCSIDGKMIIKDGNILK